MDGLSNNRLCCLHLQLPGQWDLMWIDLVGDQTSKYREEYCDYWDQTGFYMPIPGDDETTTSSSSSSSSTKTTAAAETTTAGSSEPDVTTTEETGDDDDDNGASLSHGSLSLALLASLMSIYLSLVS